LVLEWSRKLPRIDLSPRSPVDPPGRWRLRLECGRGEYSGIDEMTASLSRYQEFLVYELLKCENDRSARHAKPFGQYPGGGQRDRWRNLMVEDRRYNCLPDLRLERLRRFCLQPYQTRP